MRAAAKAACQRSKSGHPKSELLVAIPTVAPLRLTVRRQSDSRAVEKARTFTACAGPWRLETTRRAAPR
jgi:hypothetical protein